MSIINMRIKKTIGNVGIVYEVSTNPIYDISSGSCCQITFMLLGTI